MEGSCAAGPSYQSYVIIALIPQLRRRKVRQRTTQTVTHTRDRIRRVCGSRTLHGGEHACPGLLPGGVETTGGGAAGADLAGVVDGEVEVSQPVADGFAAAEGDDNDAVSGVGGDVASYVCGERAGERVSRGFALCA